ncbi:uncharacterized protein N7498_009600 [Penicillium cinerascens]|uniref:Uncharacterized protein n=1 Tax=Penicillium cinerascens TaxID=70096 RepID=A0A9W9M624_9EURO|nr:uncharacterized protein N7498_009600 [Penicillium cinerascens]KAJ5190615.1 hypothetical protein N7498_009600 [Penicillium cinerascens]
MNDSRGAPSSRGVPHVEASANSPFVNTMPPAPGEPDCSEEIQVPRSPQRLSLQINGLNAGSHEKYDPNTTCVESSERGSDTSGDSRQPELQSASTFTDYLPSIPSSSLNDPNRSMDGKSQASTTDQDSQDTLKSLPVNGHGGLGVSHADVKLERESEDSLGPLRSSNQSSSRSGVGKSTLGHKRTATGDIKPISSNLGALQTSDTNWTTRRRSKSTGSPAHGSRIAQLSVHIRTRLSYAAAKIEKARQSREIAELPPARARNPHRHQVVAYHHQSPTQHLHPSAISSPGKLLTIPKLAPPVDIISSNGDTRRRRPNSYLASKSFERSPYGRHRRHHSNQEHLITRPLNGSPSVLGPGTPSIPPYRQAPTSSQEGFYGSRTQSQSTSMEQDAIETLMFMSSPENSGYRSSPRPLQPPAAQRSLNESIYSKHNGMKSHTQCSQGEASHPGQGLPSKIHGLGLEAGAGDEIDRLLDQMESDSEDDARYASHRLAVKGQVSKGHHPQSR